MSAAVLHGFVTSVTQRMGAFVCSTTDGKKVKFDPVTLFTLFSTIAPMILSAVQKCRELKNQKDVQPSVVGFNENPVKAKKQRADLTKQILFRCRQLKAEEKKAAKREKRPADLGRFEIDEAAAARLADHSIASFVRMNASDAEKLVAYCQTGV